MWASLFTPGCAEPIKDVAASTEIFPVLLERLQASEKTEWSSRLLYAMTNLCTKNSTNQDAFRHAGGIPILLSYFQSDEHDESLRNDASTTLWACSLQNKGTLDLLCEEETFSSLQQCLVMETEKVLVGIVATISNIAAFSPANRDMLRTRSVIPLILDFLRGTHSPLLETAAGAVLSFIRDNGMRSLSLRHSCQRD